MASDGQLYPPELHPHAQGYQPVHPVQGGANGMQPFDGATRARGRWTTGDPALWITAGSWVLVVIGTLLPWSLSQTFMAIERNAGVTSGAGLLTMLVGLAGIAAAVYLRSCPASSRLLLVVGMTAAWLLSWLMMVVHFAGLADKTDNTALVFTDPNGTGRGNSFAIGYPASGFGLMGVGVGLIIYWIYVLGTRADR